MYGNCSAEINVYLHAKKLTAFVDLSEFCSPYGKGNLCMIHSDDREGLAAFIECVSMLITAVACKIQ